MILFIWETQNISQIILMDSMTSRKVITLCIRLFIFKMRIDINPISNHLLSPHKINDII